MALRRHSGGDRLIVAVEDRGVSAPSGIDHSSHSESLGLGPEHGAVAGDVPCSRMRRRMVGIGASSWPPMVEMIRIFAAGFLISAERSET